LKFARDLAKMNERLSLIAKEQRSNHAQSMEEHKATRAQSSKEQRSHHDDLIEEHKSTRAKIEEKERRSVHAQLVEEQKFSGVPLKE